MELQAKLKKYKAKSDDTTIYQHNEGLLNTLSQLQSIHNISNTQYKSLQKTIIYHDIGKVAGEFQVNIENTHRKMRHEILSASIKDLTEYEKLSILLHHKTIDRLIQYIDNIYYNEQLQEVKDKMNIEVEDIMPYLKKICRTNRKNYELLSNKELILQLGYLKLCDHTASAGIKEIDIGFNAKETYKFEKYRSIQQKILNYEKMIDIPIPDIIIQAPTGGGKTESSLLFSYLMQNVNRSRRIFYILPYIASINALYKRFKKDSISTGVLHSKVKSLLNKEEDIDDIMEELQLFKKNTKQITIGTLFQLIKAMFQCKNFEMLLAQLNNSIIIIDEIHCFDIRNFTLLIETLKYLKANFNISICIMSASIPSCMLNKIKKELNINIVINADKEDYLIRHHINYFDSIIDNHLEKIEDNLNKDKQVLLCVNNVEYSQELHTYFKSKYPNKNIKLIHSRFNAKDRTEHEQDLKDCDLLIGTQAIEVSLDIDYDILFTEIAPLDSLLQRFGRVNRKGLKGISEIYIFKERSNRSVYDKDIISRTKESLDIVIDTDKGIICEDKVNTYLDLVYPEFNEKEYNNIKNDFDNMIQSLRVGYYNENATEEIIENDDTVTVLPISLLNTYITYKNNKQYIEANELMLSVYKNWGEYYYDGNLKIFISNFKYDSNIGLVKEIDTDVNFL